MDALKIQELPSLRSPILIAAFAGWRRGLIASALSLLGLVAGAYAGSRLAPHLLRGGSASQWTPLAGLAGAVLGASVGERP